MTTILTVRRGQEVAIGGDGQVTLGSTVFKKSAVKIRQLNNGKAYAGFAGSTADAFALLERFEKKLSEHNQNILRASIELAKDWRTDRSLRRLESMMVVTDREKSLLLGGSGDVIEPDDGILGIGSGGAFATAAARALLKHSDLSAKAIVEESLRIAADICVYTNSQITVHIL